MLRPLNSNTQYGYKKGIPAIDAIVQIEQLLQEHRSKNTLNIHMDLPKALGALSRTLVLAALYKKGLPIRTTRKIAQCLQNTTLWCKEMGPYGTQVGNNVGVSKEHPYVISCPPYT